MQFLLFSATFNEIIKDYALRVTADNGKEEVNQVGRRTPSFADLDCRAASSAGSPAAVQ